MHAQTKGFCQNEDNLLNHVIIRRRHTNNYYLAYTTCSYQQNPITRKQRYTSDCPKSRGDMTFVTTIIYITHEKHRITEKTKKS